MSQEVRVAVVGCGTIARGAHIRNYLRIPGVELIVVADVDEEAARKTAEPIDRSIDGSAVP